MSAPTGLLLLAAAAAQQTPLPVAAPAVQQTPSPSAAPAVEQLPTPPPTPPSVGQPAATHTSGAAQPPSPPAAPVPAAPVNPPAAPPPPPPAPRASTTRACPVCPQTVAKKSYADHIKVHTLRAQQDSRPANWPCSSCRHRGTVCLVALNPGKTGLNTFACEACLHRHGQCSHTNNARSMQTLALSAGTHPALLPREQDPWSALRARAS